MKRTIYVMATLAFVACGEEKVTYNCECSAVCGASTASVTSTVCATKDEAQNAVDEAVSSCDADLVECTSHSCECTCTPTDTSCE